MLLLPQRATQRAQRINKKSLCEPCATLANFAVNTICTAHKDCAGQQCPSPAKKKATPIKWHRFRNIFF